MTIIDIRPKLYALDAVRNRNNHPKLVLSIGTLKYTNIRFDITICA